MPLFTVSLPADADIRAVITAAGGNPDINRFDGATWYVDAASQDALNTAAAAYNYTGDHLANAKAAAIAALAARRFAAETGGITLPDGTKVATDRDSQALITGAYAAAVNNVLTSFSFKAQSGFVTLTAAQLIAIATAVSQHVQVCFANEAALAAQITAAADTTALAAISLDAGWPA